MAEPESVSQDSIKYVLVSGGVISSIGKGIITSSLGTLLKSVGLRVTAIKIDPYLNIDAGTFSPYEHGEVFVLNDGGEVDLDLGNYERFLDIALTKDNNITTGKIYQHVINKERRGDYLGKTVQVIPHITDTIQEWVERVARIPVESSGEIPQVCVIELGGTIGDIEGMAFIDAFRQFQFKVGHHNFCNIHVSLVPEVGSSSEQKTKPTQNSVRQLRGLGLTPDLIVCRSKRKVDQSVRTKISQFCHVPPEQVLSVHDCPSIYQVPLLLHNQSILNFLSKRLNLPCLTPPRPPSFLNQWKNLADRYDNIRDDVKIVLVGKYTKLEDAYTSVIKALKHAALFCRRKLNLVCVEAELLEEETKDTNPTSYHTAWGNLCSANGILVPGGFGGRGIEGKIVAARYAREKNIPYLGVCLGMQTAVIEFARNILDWKDANSKEFNTATTHPVVIEMPEHHPGDMGGTMRLGLRETRFRYKDTVIGKLYGSKKSIKERHRHRYEVNPKLIDSFESKGLRFVGEDTDGQRMEIMEITGHQYFVGVQYHPEYLTRPLKPSPPYLGLILASCGKLQNYIARGCIPSPRCSYEYYSDDSDTELNDEVTQAFGRTASSNSIGPFENSPLSCSPSNN
ncbi:PREDICTED: CTP synthase 2-like [Amphimedon queenslandica]|uniref:CTP synthase n=1 Tax=Amphimedon queenslandica TaxID=400682 RepID=A0A1X7VJJ6_AMPQE|nr:PREDICTED: CTP synthase 2-like [Amphimedon queenslandica]|eukprot:XP_003384096.1 PREDICTED: CTP synthase 2-like [Amphimedon queenslandica]